MKTYVDYVYEIVKNEMGCLDAVYEDYIVHVVGHAGLTELRSNGLLEPCGVVEGRQLYALVNREAEYVSYRDKKPHTILFETREDAEKALNTVKDMIETYGWACVADLYEIAGLSSTYTDARMGWTRLDDADVVESRDGYGLRLPRPVPWC